MATRVRATLDFLRVRQQARDAGCPVSFTTDPAWLVNEAINRRAGWLEDRHTRGTTRPVNGRLPRKAVGDYLRGLRLLAWRINTPRLVVRESELGEFRSLAFTRFPHRITFRQEEG